MACGDLPLRPIDVPSWIEDTVLLFRLVCTVMYLLYSMYRTLFLNPPVHTGMYRCANTK